MMSQPRRAVRPRHAIPLVLALLGGCSPPSAQLPVARVGLLASLTAGQVDISGRNTRDGAALAEREINDAGGVDVGGVRYRVEIVVVDVPQGADEATSAAQSLLTRPDIVAIIGPQYSRNALPVAVLAEHARVPMVTPMASHPAVTAGRRWVFRIAFTDGVQAEALADWARQGLHATRAAMLFEESASYSGGIAARFADAFTRAGGRVVAREAYTRDQAGDFSAALRRIATQHPDVLLLPNELPDDTLQIRQAGRAGLVMPFLLPDFVDPRLMGALPSPGGLFTTHHWHLESDTPENRAFVAHFTNRFHRPPNATAASTYDAVRLVADAMHRAGSTQPEPLRAAISSTHAYHGATGTLDFGGHQDPAKRAVVLRLDHDRLVVVRGAAR